MATLGHWEVIATSPRAMDEIRQAPDNILSFIDYMNRVCYLLLSRFLVILLIPDCCLTMKLGFVMTEQLVQSEYTIGHAVAFDPYHVGIIRNQLTKNLGVMFSSVREEIAQAFEENLALAGHGEHFVTGLEVYVTNHMYLIVTCAEWTSVPALETMMKIVCRSTNRACVGLPLCKCPRPYPPDGDNNGDMYRSKRRLP